MKEPEIEVTEEYKKKMQKEGMYDAYQGEKAQIPDCPYYMMGYNSVEYC